jgi:hypothetical protein
MKSHFILRTTINMNAVLLDELKEKCKERDVSVCGVIREALRLYFDECTKIADAWHTVSYQKKGPEYKKFHFRMTAREYDSYLDFKKFHRLSFSFIVALALEKFAELVLSGELKNSYPLQGYTKMYIQKNNYHFLLHVGEFRQNRWF